MLNNKNNKISTLSIEWSPLARREPHAPSWIFKFNILYSLVMFLGIGLCLVAANWQYTKAQFFQKPQAQQFLIEGQFLNAYTHFLDNQTLNGRAGYAVITPFEYDGSIYLVDRGYIGYDSRSELPMVSNVEGQVRISGYVKTHHKPLLLNDSLQDPLHLRLQYVDAQRFSQLLNKPVKDQIFVLKEGEGLLEPFPEQAPYLSHHRHMGYAIQWLLLALAGVCIWLIASIKRGIKK